MTESKSAAFFNDEVTPDSTDDGFEPITTQDALNKIIEQRVTRERAKFADYADLKKKAADFDSVQKTAEERIAAIESELKAERRQAMKATVSAETGTPAKWIQGETLEEMQASAADFQAELAARTKSEKRPAPAGLKSGASSSDSRLDPQERAAAALRNYTKN